MLRYSNRSIFETMEDSPSFFMWNPGNATNVDQFNQVLRNLLDSLISNASIGDSQRKFAAANVSGPGFQTIYGLVQCTPDLSEQECSKCLFEAITVIPHCCDGKKGGRDITPSCNFRYEIYPFYDSTNVVLPPPLALPPSSTDVLSTEGKSNTSRTVIAIVVPIIAFVTLVILICIYLRMRSRKQIEVEAENDDEIGSVETLQLDFATIVAATNNFSDANKLGQGGFGPVYKGRLSNGQEVAVKRLSRNSLQGDMEFKNEVLLVAKLQHRNLVKLLGFCLERRERLLVYEFVPNKSLDFFIFDQIRRSQLDWEKRYKIIRGITRGLLYLHEDSRLRIIHRDLKASNILLDAVMHPKVSDFGMARLVEIDQTQGNTNRIVGTYGYMAPEYVMYGQFSVKSDVFSFGVLVLEIVSGQKNSCARRGENVVDLLTSTRQNWREGTASNIVDPAITDGSRNEMMRCIHIALLCVQENVADRPTMASVALMLNSYSVTLPLPSQPAFSIDSRSLSVIQSEENDSEAGTSEESNIQSVQASVNEASITEPFPR
ncbi:cysteine-rich receptor-like protein kinase 25 [Cajanus cajan]|uniref:cysteine-rich receptor-like protein kinase 25 n=1 Tax=Cajanus cajan TaxID=3821 RepID=UPI0010FB0150|nr:cysteine-rich receptor-like protein kinase 25 [Cajanus cajan]